ncbi:MAG TPA: enoyl-CoA hydratase-related protein [Puia sp.]|nr:enoyl-CoA hydratase-related protein [Puia sp.]
MYKTLLTELSDNILTVMINRPDKLNALNKEVMSELGEVVEEIYSNKDIRSAIITGAGQRAFVAGADISEFLGLTPGQGQELSAKGNNIFFRIASSPKPIAAAVNGFALGGGCELAMACHFRLCVPTAKFGQPEVNLGLIPGYGGTQRLTQLVGRGRAIEIMLTGRMVEATEAHTIGLVNYIVEEPNELLTKTRELLSVINEKAPLAIARVIECANIAAGDGAPVIPIPLSHGHSHGAHSTHSTHHHGDATSSGGGRAGNSADTSWEPDPFGGDARPDDNSSSLPSGLPSARVEGSGMMNGFAREQQAFGECFATLDMQEGANAFLAKRKPHFTGR